MKDAMSNAGLGCPDELIAEGRIIRYTPEGDRKLSGNGWYILYDMGDIQAGAFGTWKDPDNPHKWCSKSATEFTPEEKKAYALKMAAAKRQREAELAKEHAECREKCAVIWAAGVPATNDHPALVRKQVKSYGLRVSGDSLMVPLNALDKAEGLHSIQFILPEKNADGKDKFFKRGTAKTGHFHLISTGPPIDNTMIVCEGYATGASIHEATGHAVLVAFDAGNLKAVAEVVRGKYPTWTIIIAGDNDQWTKDNPGKAKGLEAAKAVRGEFVMPTFADLADPETKPTDFNDLFVLEGAAMVKRQVFPPPIADYQPPCEDYGCELPEHDPNVSRVNPLTGGPFQLLGYDHGEFFYLPKGAPQVTALKASEHTTANLLTLASLNHWEGKHPGGRAKGFDATAAADELIRANQGLGVYSNLRIRGRGAWEDNGRTVLHLGDELVVNGVKTPLSAHPSKWIYEAGSRLELDGEKQDEMTNADAHKLLDLCGRFNWDKKISAEFLAGWMVIAPLCGAMPWRPHILVTGAAGSGKSTISDQVIRKIVGLSAICCLGNTTEAGLRSEAGSDARPVLFDEAESGGDASKRMQAVLELARQSSSDIGYSVLKGSQSGKSVKYQPRLCFCFSSIGSAAVQQADNDRITTLSLTKDERIGHDARWKATQKAMNDLLTKEYCQAFRSRNHKLMPVILANYEIFKGILGVKFDSQRIGDQYGAFLAGSYTLRSKNVIDPAKAQEWIDGLEWSDSIVDATAKDEVQCLGVILQHQIRTDSNVTYTVGEMLETASLSMNTNHEAARATLLRHGIKVTDTLDGFYIANKHTALDKILEKTPWSKNWGHILARIAGAVKTKPVNFTAGAYARSVLLPLSILTEGVE